MPIYQYECLNGHTFDLRQDYDAPVTATCECGKGAIRKVSPFGFAFKGGRPSNEGVSKVNPKARRVRV